MVVVAIVLFLYAIITESLDWLGRMDIIEQRWPKLGAFAESRKLRLAIFLIGIALLVRVLMESHPVAYPSKETAKSPAAEPSKTNTATGATGQTVSPIPQPSFGTRMALPDGRTIISLTPEELQAAHDRNTAEQFNRLLGGVWIKISGKVINNYGRGIVFLTLTEGRDPSLMLHFGKAWDEQLAALPRGSSVTIRGKVQGTDGSTIRLYECELL